MAFLLTVPIYRGLLLQFYLYSLIAFSGSCQNSTQTVADTLRFKPFILSLNSRYLNSKSKPDVKKWHVNLSVKAMGKHVIKMPGLIT